MGHLIGTARMPAVARQLQKLPGIMTVVAAEFAILGRFAVASGMRAFLVVCHLEIPPLLDSSKLFLIQKIDAENPILIAIGDRRPFLV